jgi:hypothetical protein
MKWLAPLTRALRWARAALTPRVIAVGVSILLLLGWFYWFHFRPAKIRGKCHDVAMEWAEKEYHRENPSATDTLYLSDDYEHFYDLCLHSEGLE